MRSIRMSDTAVAADPRAYIARVRWRFAKTMPQWKQLATILERCGPLEVKAAAQEMFGRDDDRACGQVRAIFNRNHGKDMVRLPDGRLRSRNWPLATRVETTETKPTLRVVNVSDGDPEPLPF